MRTAQGTVLDGANVEISGVRSVQVQGHARVIRTPTLRTMDERIEHIPFESCTLSISCCDINYPDP